MGLGHYLFGFSGRINRAKQWAVLLVGLAHYIILLFAFSFTIGFVTIGALIRKETTAAAVIGTPQAQLFGIIFCVLALIGFYISLAVMIKRLHDRNKSAWWVLVFAVLPLALNVPVFMDIPVQMAHVAAVMKAVQAHLPPPPQPVQSPLLILLRGAAAIIGIWAFVELYCLRGTVGENRHGPDPLAGRG
ncbi:MAG TPA: DUF805 domain-containing protein [Rhizomicrobium sp.]|jgi:uncharacterized membrane protein YhaH (DUF805 family)|nr:DUF805 domain-containing protein [Rhizomicrobium sp.]